MLIDDDVFLAILAMDAYNRGTQRKLDVGGAGLGYVELSALGEVTEESFFAQSYIWHDEDDETWNNKKIISYRGTDAVGDIPDWAADLGFYDTDQTRLAAAFYQQINGDSAAQNENIFVTGHSLGGGLAGFVGSIYGLDGLIFDNMCFELSAENLYSAVTVPNYPDFEALEHFYDNQTPNPPNSSELEGYYVEGEWLDVLDHRVAQETDLTPLDPNITPNPVLTPTDLHNQALLAILLYAEKHVGEDWFELRTDLIYDFFSEEIAEAIGIGGAGDGGSATAAFKMRMMIAYSAIGDGVRPYGDTDGASFDQWNRDELGPCIGYLPQDVELFDGTVLENIARFDPAAADEKIVAAATMAGVHEMILGFSDGYDTVIGANGSTLSAGQRQRIALARVLYGDPVLVVLDEPNSNLDAEGDAALTEAIRQLRSRGATVVVIAHRPSAIAGLDLLLMLKDGKQVAFGPKDRVLGEVTHVAVPAAQAS